MKQAGIQQDKATKAPFWVVVGASAGGLDALKELLSTVDHALSAIYLVAQHLDPKHPTILRDLLARSTSLPVVLVEADLLAQPNTIYIVSPGHDASIEQGMIKLTPAAAVGPKPSVSRLFNSLAQAVGERSIAVVLSGTGSDGAQGVSAVKAAGGLVIAQNEASAKYSGMPNAAIETGCVDLVLAPSQMAQAIAGYIESAGQTLVALSQAKNRTSLEKVFQALLDQTGYDFSGYKMKTVQRRIARRMAVHKLVELDAYVALLQRARDEVDSLFKDLLISVTDFFRDLQAFEDLAQVVEQLVAAHEDGEQIRVWVPGCAAGEEAYSISILFSQARERLRKNVNYQIFATDIDEFALSLARKGQYSQAQVKNLQPELLSRYFHQKEGGQYLIHKSVRDQVVFARQNLVMDAPFSRLDLISCRNVLIYFSLDLQKQVFQTFHFALKTNGYLFLGKSESASSGAAELFEAYNKRSQIFRRKNTHLSPGLDHVSSAVSVARTRQRRDTSAPLMLQQKSQVIHQLDQVLLNQMVPTAIVVDASGQVLHLRGEVGAYLSFPQGRIDTNILTLVRDDLKVDVRALLQKARRDGVAATQALFYNNDAAGNALFINVKRIDLSDNTAQEMYVVSFTQVDLSEAFISGTGLLSEDSRISNDSLRKEIAVFKERLQTSIEELETTNEELQSTNEELQSANEELQSANEELQTANEEMQSTNEELSTVNQELEVKTYELEQVNNDLENMLAQMREIVVLVDNRLRLQRFTQRAAQELDLSANDIGQTLTTLGMSLDVPNLRQALLDVIESEQEKSVRVRKQARVYHLRLVPYKSDAVKVVGVMLFFESTPVSALPASQFAEPLLALLGAHQPCALIAIDALGVMIYANSKVTSLLGYAPQDLLFNNVKMLMPEPYRSHHDGYLQAYVGEQALGSVGKWRDISALHQDGSRLLLSLRVEEFWLQGERHFLGFMCRSEELDAYC